MTAYTILLRVQRDPSAEHFWQEVSQRDAGSPAGAVRGYLKDADKGGGVFVAVPLRSWAPASYRIEQVRRVVEEEVDA